MPTANGAWIWKGWFQALSFWKSMSFYMCIYIYIGIGIFCCLARNWLPFSSPTIHLHVDSIHIFRFLCPRHWGIYWHLMGGEVQPSSKRIEREHQDKQRKTQLMPQKSVASNHNNLSAGWTKAGWGKVRTGRCHCWSTKEKKVECV